MIYYFGVFINNNKVGILAPIAAVMLPEAMALVRWRSI